MLLAIDSCGSLGGVALGGHEVIGDLASGDYRDTVLLFRELAGKTFSEQLLSTITEVLSTARVSPSQVSGIVVIHGPGSFTGIRIGVSAAKGLAEGLGIPIIAVSRLELLARCAAASETIAILDAGRGEFFTGVYRGKGSICEAEALSRRDELASMVAESDLPLVVCEDRVLDSLTEFNPLRVRVPTAVDALVVGAQRFRTGRFDEVSSLDANYLRKSESEMLSRIAEHAAIRAAEAATRG
jgi:tRNA threonylcarbamoyladenosine biosynthesis protein TsaB